MLQDEYYLTPDINQPEQENIEVDEVLEEK